MALAYVQDNNGTTTPVSGTASSGTLTSVGNGNIIVGFMLWDVGSSNEAGITVISATDSSGDTVTMRGTIQYSSLVKYYVQGFTVVNASNTASHTITITTTNTLGLSGSGVYLLEYSGQDAAAPYDTAAGATGIDNTLPTVSISTSVANEYLIFAGVFGASLTGGTGVTIQISNTGTWYQRGGDKLAASSGSNTFAMSGNATTGWVLHGVAIKPAGGVGTTPLTFTGSDSLAGGELL